MTAVLEAEPTQLPRRALFLIGICGAILVIVIAVAMRIAIVVEPGTVAVSVIFGKVIPSAMGEGLHFVNPLGQYPRMNIRRQILEMSSGGGAQSASGGAELIALSKEQLALAVDIGFPFSLNREAAWKVYQRIGDDVVYRDDLFRPAARSAVRDAVARFTWEQAAATQREQLAEAIHARLQDLVIAEMQQLGLAPDEARNAFLILPVQLRRVLPPQQIQDAVSAKVRAEQDLQRQTTLSEIARIEATQREFEGLAVAKLFDNLPQGYTPEQIAILLNSLANKERADAVLTAAKNDRVSTIIFEGSPPPISILPRQ